ncbi:hypothetical protein DYS74_11525 [Sinirhodobacter hankyongi]|uniref:Uncharacterized protein n=2 Tax=Paenirhodobacter hankyongi TaxID=2294033 RepID=A0A421BMV9_9RHOB|nr:hypothetical protein DYS74_11525 [Sinirhodobacter hankyongi]
MMLAGCSGGPGKDPIPLSASGPITTYPIIGTSKVPQGTTPTGSTGYAVANSARSNGSIVAGTAATCGAANAGGEYELACAQAAGQPGAASPYK